MGVSFPAPEAAHGLTSHGQITLSRRKKKKATETAGCLKSFSLLKRQYLGDRHPVPAWYRELQTVLCWRACRLKVVISTPSSAHC